MDGRWILPPSLTPSKDMKVKNHYGVIEERCREYERQIEEAKANLLKERVKLGAKVLAVLKNSEFTCAMLCRISGINRGTVQACIAGRCAVDKINEVYDKLCIADDKLKSITCDN
jgi:hypothetical protein